MTASAPRSHWHRYLAGMWTLLAAGTAFLIAFWADESLATALAAAFTSALFWWWLIERPSNLTYREGARFGFFAQLAAYPVAFFLS